MNPKLLKIFFITFFSIVIALIYNHFNPIGIKLIREDRILKWENDSLELFNKKDSSIVDTILNETNQSHDSVKESTEKEFVESFMEPKAIKLNFAYKLFKQNIQFIDARSPEEFSEGHIKNAINIPFYGSENYLDVISGINKNEIVVTYCSSAECDIAALSGDELFEMGFKKVYVFVGGYEEWIKNEYPVITKIN